MAAAAYRANLFGQHPFGLFDLHWYGGHYLLGYSLLAPALGWLLGVRLCLAASGLAAAPAFALLAESLYRSPGAAALSAAFFAFGFTAELWSARQPFDLGFAFGLWALVALWRSRRLGAALLLGLLTGLTSPVAGLFLALVATARALGGRLRPARPAAADLALAAIAIAPPGLLTLLFGEGGYEPFAASAFWPAFGAAALLLGAVALLPFQRAATRPLAFGILLYLLLLLGSFLIRSPLGSNALRLGALVGPPLAAGGLAEPPRRTLLLALLAPALLYWQTAATVHDQLSLASNPATNQSFFASLRRQVVALSHGKPVRIEVPMVKSHDEALWLAGGPLLLARGWERQLDTRFAGLFYGTALRPQQLRNWLYENGVSYLALPKAPLDSAGRLEAALLADRPPFLKPVFANAGWRLYAVAGSPGLIQPAGAVEAVGAEALTLRLPGPGTYRLAFRYTPYWRTAAPACPFRLPGGWLGLAARRGGVLRLEVSLSLSGLVGSSCRPTAGKPPALR